MFKKIKYLISDAVTFTLGTLFALVVNPILRLTGLDRVDCGPSPEDIEKANKLAAELKREREK